MKLNVRAYLSLLGYSTKQGKKKNQPAHKKVVAPMGKMNKIAKKMTQQSKQEVQQMHRMLQDMDDSMSQNVSDESSSRHI